MRSRAVIRPAANFVTAIALVIAGDVALPACAQALQPGALQQGASQTPPTANASTPAADQQFALATGHYVRGNHEFAAEELRTFLDKHATDGRVPEATFYLGESCSQLRQFAAAGQAYGRYVELRPDGHHARVARFRLAECLYFQGADSAEAALREFTTSFPDDELNDFAQPYLANVISKRDPRAGITAFREALKQRPRGPLGDECRLGLARCLADVAAEEKTSSVEAERILQALAAKAASGAAPKAQYFLARSYFSSRKYAEAEATFTALLQNFPPGEWTPFAQLGQARAILDAGRVVDAAPLFARLLDDPQVGIDARYWLGIARKNQTRFAEAAELLLPLARQAPQHELADDALFHAADALRVLEQWPAAEAAYAELLNGYAESSWQSEALLGRARVALSQEEHQLVDRCLAPIYFSDDPLIRLEARRVLAQSLLADEKPEAAIAELEPLLEQAADDPRPDFTRYLLATAYSKAGAPNEALTILATVDDREQTTDAATPTAGINLAAEKAFTQAGAQLALEQYAAAAKSLDEFLVKAADGDPRRKLAAGELVVCLVKSGAPAERITAALAAWRQIPGDSAELQRLALRVAEALYDAGNFAQAANAFAANVAGLQHSRQPDVQLLAQNRSGLGWSHDKLGHANQAIAAWEDVVRHHPQLELAAEAAMLLARAHEAKQHAVATRAAYRHVIDQHPGSPLRPAALLQAAVLAAKERNTAEARDLYALLLSDYPQDARRDEALYQSAWLAADSGDAAAATEHFRQLSQACPDSKYWGDATWRVATADVAAKDYSSANAAVVQLLQRGEERLRPYALFLQGKIAWEEARFADVAAPLDQLVQESPRHELALAAGYFAADARVSQNQWQAAATRWQQLAELAATNPGAPADAWPAKIALRRAQTLALLQDWNAAREVSAAALAAAPDFEFNFEHQFIIGRALATAGRLTDARDAYQRVLASPQGAQSETAAKAQLMLAETYFHQQNFDQAVREYLKVEILYGYRPWQAAGLFQAGVCYEKLGKPERARDQYERVVRDFADTEYGARAAQRLR